MQTIASQAIPQETPPLPLGCATRAAVRSTAGYLQLTQSCLLLLDPPNFVMALLRRNRR